MKNDSALQLVNELKSLGSGVNIVMAKCDITDREQVQQLANANCDMPPCEELYLVRWCFK